MWNRRRVDYYAILLLLILGGLLGERDYIIIIFLEYDRSESMISQAFQACYSVEGCPSNCYILSLERIGYMIENFYQLNLLPRLPLTYSRESHLQPQELLR